MATLMGMQKETKLVLFLMAFVLYLLGPGQETILAVDQPDLIMNDVSPTAGTVNAGATFLVGNTVKNQGASSSGGFGITFHLSTDAVYGGGDDVVISGARSVKSLEVGATDMATTALKIPKTAAGNYYVCAMADSASKVIEGVETNNTFCSTSQVTVPRPDLIMTDVSPTAGTVNAGATLLVNNAVKNQGTLSAGGFGIAFHLSTDAVYGGGDDVVISGARSVKSLAVGATDMATTALKIPKTAAGSYYVCAMADSASKVIENEEDNNTFCSASQITVPRPDLIMTDVSPNAGTVNAGATLLVNNAVKNQGTLSSGGFGITFHLSTDAVYGGGDDVVISGARSVKSLAVGASDTATTALKIPKAAAGSYYVCGMADGAGKVIEDEEANNGRCTAAPIMVTVSGTSNPDSNGTLLYSIDSDEGFILWHKIVVDEDGDAMALWDVANAITNISSVWASYYNHTAGQWGQAQKITDNDIVSYFSLPETKFDQNGAFVVANTGNNLAGSSTWWNRFDPATGWGTQRTLPDGREAFGVNTRGEIFSQKSNKEVARYDTATGILTPNFTASENFGSETTAAFANLDGELLEASAHFGINATKLVVSLFSYTPAGGWAGQVDAPVLTFPNTTGMIPLQTALARDGSGRIAVVVAGKSCNPSCNITTHGFVAAIYFDGAQWGAWRELDSSDAPQVVQVSAPSVKIDDEGRAVAFWSNSAITLQPKLRAAAYTPGSDWGTATDLNTASFLITSGPNYPGNYTPEDIFAMSGNGNAIVSWMDQVNGFRIRENRFHPATGWAGETLVRQFPISTTGGARTPKAQVNSTGKGFRTWVWLSVDPKTYPHTLISTDELRAEPITTDDSLPTTTTTSTTTTSSTTTLRPTTTTTTTRPTTTTTTRSTTTTTTAGAAGVDIDVTLATPTSGNTNISGSTVSIITEPDTLEGVPVTRIQVDATTNAYLRRVQVYFETSTGNVMQANYSWGTAFVYENSVHCPAAGCTGASVNKTTKVITFVNTALDNSSLFPPTDKFATLNGSIQYP